MSRVKLIIDCDTGEEREVPMTPDEEAELDALAEQQANQPAPFGSGQEATPK